MIGAAAAVVLVVLVVIWSTAGWVPAAVITGLLLLLAIAVQLARIARRA